MLTELGFKRMRYNDFLPIIEQQARELFGENVNLSERSPLGMFVRLQAYSRAEENELAEEVYYSAQVEKATGVSLDAAVKSAGSGITRLQSKKAIGRVKLNISGGVTVPKGSIVGTKDGIKFITKSDVLSNTLNDYFTDIEALEYGEIGNVPPNTITEIFTPIQGWNSVTNTEQTIKGQDRETDEQLRSRYFNGGLSVRGSATVTSIRAKLLDEVEGVTAALVLENDTLEITEDGITEKSIYPIVLGGDKQEIAQKIFDSKAGGVKSYGTTIVIITDEMGEPHKIGFDYASKKPIFVKVELKTNSDFPLDGDDRTRLEIVKYIGGNDPDGNLYKGLSMGQTVINAKVLNSIFRVEGVEDAKVTMSIDNLEFTEENITVIRSEVAQTNFPNVVITHV